MPLAATQDPIAQAARAISGTGTTFGPQFGLNPAVDWVSIVLNCTAAGGTTPSVTVSVQWSMDGTVWADADATAADAFTAMTAAGVSIKRFNVKAPYCRLKEVTTGTTPTLTYTPTFYYRQAVIATFIPPQRGNRGWVLPDTPEWQQAPFKYLSFASSPPYSANVFKLNDGTFTEQQPTDPTTIAITYYGGHEYPVSAAEVAALVAAGYGANIS